MHVTVGALETTDDALLPTGAEDSPERQTAHLEAMRRIRAALKVVPAERLSVAPDCGMKYLPRDTAFGKLKAMVEGTKIVRREIGAAG